MDSVPLAADFCWTCGLYSGQSIGIDPDGVLDHPVHYRTCSRCKLSRFCSAECLQSAWLSNQPAVQGSTQSNYKFLCNANQAFSVEFRHKLRCLRDSFPCQSQPRYLSMLQAIHWCWGLKYEMVVFCDLHPSVCQRLNGVTWGPPPSDDEILEPFPRHVFEFAKFARYVSESRAYGGDANSRGPQPAHSGRDKRSEAGVVQIFAQSDRRRRKSAAARRREGRSCTDMGE
jgi:hypothetical protein